MSTDQVHLKHCEKKLKKLRAVQAGLLKKRWGVDYAMATRLESETAAKAKTPTGANAAEIEKLVALLAIDHKKMAADTDKLNSLKAGQPVLMTTMRKGIGSNSGESKIFADATKEWLDAADDIDELTEKLFIPEKYYKMEVVKYKGRGINNGITIKPRTITYPIMVNSCDGSRTESAINISDYEWVAANRGEKVRIFHGGKYVHRAESKLLAAIFEIYQDNQNDFEPQTVIDAAKWDGFNITNDEAIEIYQNFHADIENSANEWNQIPRNKQMEAEAENDYDERENSDFWEQ